MLLRYPVSLRYEITPARLLMNPEPARMYMKTEKRGYTMRSHPIRLQLDNREFFESIGIKSMESSAAEKAEAGKEAVQAFMERKAQQKNAMLEPEKLEISEVWAQTWAQRAAKMAESVLTFIPDKKPEIGWADGYIEVDFEPDKLEIDWDTGGVSFEYIPYRVEFFVEKWAAQLGLEPKENM